MSKTIKEIAKELNCSIYNVYAALHSGKLQGTKVGKYWDISDEAIKEYKENRRPRGGVCSYFLHAGDQFGCWTIVDPEIITWKTGARMVLCQCICGKKSLVNEYTLIHGYSRSCGCKKAKNFITTISNKQKLQ